MPGKATLATAAAVLACAVIGVLIGAYVHEVGGPEHARTASFGENATQSGGTAAGKKAPHATTLVVPVLPQQGTGTPARAQATTTSTPSSRTVTVTVTEPATSEYTTSSPAPSSSSAPSPTPSPAPSSSSSAPAPSQDDQPSPSQNGAPCDGLLGCLLDH